MTSPYPRLLPCGNSALVIEFGDHIDAELNTRVLALDALLAEEKIAGIAETVPTYRSLLVHYDPTVTLYSELGAKLLRLAAREGLPSRKGKRWRVPVVYGGAFGIDLEAVAARAGMTQDEVVARHTAGDYRVYMLGFLPGYTYLGGLDPKLATPRRQDPRLETPSGTVAIGGVQTGIQCITAPSGWNLLGLYAGAHLSPASRADLPDRARRSRHLLPDTRGRMGGARPRRRGRRSGRRDGRARRAMSRIVVDTVGPATSVQDVGRFGAQRYGLTTSGAMDRVSLAIANALVGEPTRAAAIEIGPLGATFRARNGDVRVALAGADRAASVAGRKAWINETMLLREGDVLQLGAARSGVFSYLAIEGGIAGEPVYGSLSVSARASLGSPYPRPLRAGDELEVGAPSTDAPERRFKPLAARAGPVRVVLGPQDDHLTPEAIALFLGSEWRISPKSDRMGYRLEGPKLAHVDGYNIVSDGTVPGSIQVPGNGQPLALLADRGTTGGYPKIATVITADLPRFAQTQAGGRVRFAAVPVEQAQDEARRFAGMLAKIEDRVETLVRKVASGVLA